MIFQNKIVTYSNGISLRRGGLTAGDTEVIVGEIGATGIADTFFRINGNGTNKIVIVRFYKNIRFLYRHYLVGYHSRNCFQNTSLTLRILCL